MLRDKFNMKRGCSIAEKKKGKENRKGRKSGKKNLEKEKQSKAKQSKSLKGCIRESGPEGERKS